jgi:putative DNA primase/helicase
LHLAPSESGMTVVADDLDRNPMLLNVSNGTIDLTTGTLRPHRQEDMITKLAPVEFDPDAECPVFDSFLTRIFNGNQDLIEFMRRALGYALTGNASEEKLFILYGSGANGKSTLVETFMAILGDYGRTASFETFLTRRNGQDGHRNDLARLQGARMVSASEMGQGRSLDEAVVKQITGRDTVAARFLHKEFFEFQPQFKPFFLTNFKPVIKETTQAIWRRLRLVPFNVTIPPNEQDKKLREKLHAESPGILTWAVRGCLDWQRDGLGVPPVVTNATDEYREEMDVIGQFLKDRCEVGPGLMVETSMLYESYVNWGDSNRENSMPKITFGRKLRDRSFEPTQIGKQRLRGWRGLALRPAPGTTV